MGYWVRASFLYSVGGNIAASGGGCWWHKELLVLFLNICTWDDPGPALPGFLRAQVSQGRGNSHSSACTLVMWQLWGSSWRCDSHPPLS